MRTDLNATGVEPPAGNSVFLVNDDERGLHADYEHWLEELAPTHRPANTNTTAPARRVLRNNVDAHLKRAVESGCAS